MITDSPVLLRQPVLLRHPNGAVSQYPAELTWDPEHTDSLALTFHHAGATHIITMSLEGLLDAVDNFNPKKPPPRRNLQVRVGHGVSLAAVAYDAGGDPDTIALTIEPVGRPPITVWMLSEALLTMTLIAEELALKAKDKETPAA